MVKKFLKKRKNKASLLLLLIILFLASGVAQAQPPLPMEIYGSARSFNSLVMPGTQIRAIDLEGNACGAFIVTNRGFFGTMSCIGENTTEGIKGASPGEIIRFRIGNFPASVLLGDTAESLGELKWESGEFKQIILVAPPLVCGDGFCDFYEDCHSCPEDCGACPIVDPESPGDPDSPDPTLSFPDIPPFPPEPETLFPEEEIEECVESWSCTEWNPCSPEGVQTRICIDENECGTEEEKPETERTCDYEEPEIGPPFEDVERPRVEAPMTIEVCDARLPILGLESLVFFLIFVLIIICPLFYLEKKKRSVKKKKLDDVDKLVSIYRLENKIYTFLIIVSVLAIIVYLYHYFFFLCIDVYHNNLWLLLLFVLLSPIIINILIHLLRYSESKKILMVKLLSDTHYKHLKYLITLFNKDLLSSEVEITNEIYSLNNRDEFSGVLIKTKEIKKIYDDLLKLYSLYKEEKDSFKIEKDLLKQIDSLDNNKEFQKAVNDYPELSSLKDNISLLYQAYESKKELVDKLDELEEKYKNLIDEDKSEEDKKPKKVDSSEDKPATGGESEKVAKNADKSDKSSASSEEVVSSDDKKSE